MAGKKNPFGITDASKDATEDFGSDNFITLQNGPASPGFVNIPTYTGRLGIENYYHLQQLRLRQGDNKQPSDICAEWPCCEVDWDLGSGSPCEGLNKRCE